MTGSSFSFPPGHFSSVFIKSLLSRILSHSILNDSTTVAYKQQILFACRIRLGVIFYLLFAFWLDLISIESITYLYYGEYRTTFYLCVFRDAYTRENLGWSIGKSMSLKLVEEAYSEMMKRHGNELEDTMKADEVYIHHDQGSQYLATSFAELLHDDGFIQSVSARGNSQDNAPMESFFGRLKTAILDMIAMCRDFMSAKRLVDGYLNAYNSDHYQYDLAGLTPEEFYQYATTGVYPLDNYFGVPASVMMTGGDLKKVRRRYADDEAATRREASQKKREEKRLVDPEKIILRDQRIAANVCGYTPINPGKIIKDGILSDIESIHRVTIDRAVERKLKSSDFN